eukprot:c29272_g1_i1 orf=461-991(+)
MIAPSSIYRAGRGLYTLTDIFVPREAYVTLMLFCGPEYTWGQWHQLSTYVVSMTTYSICSNVASIAEQHEMGLPTNYGEHLYIDGRPYTHGNIAALINSSRGDPDMTNCIFLEETRVHEEHMAHMLDHCVVVSTIHTIWAGSELLANYSFLRRDPVRVARQRAGLPLDPPRGRRPH